jgi:flagellar motor switch protein FliM
MEPLLNKAEISDLLSAIRNGTVPLDVEEGTQTTILPCTPVNLFQHGETDKERTRMPNLDIIIDNFCRLYATSLTNQLQKTFSINRIRLESIEFQKFMADKNQPGAIGILDMSPLITGALIIFDPKLSFSMLEIMLGASSELESPELDRRLTTIELNILKSSISDAGKDLDRAFSQITELNTSLTKLENNARLVSIVEPESEIVVSSLEVKVGEYSGEIHLLFPISTLEPLREQLKDLLTISSSVKSSWQQVFEEEVLDIPLTLVAQSGTLRMSVSDILKMQEGQILQLDYDPNSPLQVLVEKCAKFHAVPGTHNGNKAISLTGIIE